MFAIRQATQADLSAILELAASIPEAPRWGRDAYEGYLANPERRIFIAEEHRELIGYIAGRAVADFCELEFIVVSASDRRRGVGHALLAAFIAWARAQSASTMQLEVRAGNATAIRFYRRAGFHVDGPRPGYYRRPDEDAVLMSLSLDSRSEP